MEKVEAHPVGLNSTLNRVIVGKQKTNSQTLANKILYGM
jgi:hypothetical protein